MPNPPLTIRLRHSPAFAAQSHGWGYIDPFSIDGNRMDWAVRLPKGGTRRVEQVGCRAGHRPRSAEWRRRPGVPAEKSSVDVPGGRGFR